MKWTHVAMAAVVLAFFAFILAFVPPQVLGNLGLGVLVLIMVIYMLLW